uniref:NADH-ubiquinone oxidoreductase chain 2 n=1 Tax=Iassus lateralis TaxID=3054420 RepID=A0AA49XDX0_9HEMI|nr:NADH dehydrogenase subunit 2 [Iassus lateralis]WIW75743.1 NADH dehydrogenase subunit 2 [Iassus lateralis]WKW94143.1 NADH dehydrogenase subunit 2 [Iassus lateralis]WLN32148.1 NADH dehydrogenase subunit 2 [Iassus lateralis]
MKKNSTNNLFKWMMMFTIFSTISSNSIMMIWIMIEMSNMAFIPLMMNKSIMNSESIMKFFIIQSMSSMTILLAIMFMYMKTLPMKMMITVMLIMKMGGVPFSNWLVMTVEGMNFNMMMILFTVMKIPPLMMMNSLNLKNNLLIMLSMVLSSLMMINQNSTKKMISYSSIFNLSLLMVSIMENKLWMQFLMNYTMMMWLLTKELEKNKMMNLNQMMINNKNLLTKMSIWISMMSMGGLPPLMGFVNKMLIIELLVKNNEFMLISSLILSSSIVMFMYMKYSLSCMMMSSLLPKINKKVYSTNFNMIILNSMILPMLMLSKTFN